MRLWCFILGLIFFSAATQLFSQTSNLIVFNEVREDFTLEVNGQRINQAPAQHVRVTGLKPSQYTVKVFFVNASLPNQTIYLNLQPEREITYGLLRRGSASPLEFKFLNESTLGYFPVAPQNITVVPYNGPLTDPGLVTTQPAAPVVTSRPMPVEQVIVKPNPLPGYTGPFGCENPMEPAQFDEVKRSISAKSFSDSKMQLAKQVTRSNCLLTSQVVELISLFTFETQKLEFAKFAYEFTYDQGNYYKVNDAFGFESSIRELEQHLSGK